ncbi:Dolichol kinase [Entamoeba marina]
MHCLYAVISSAFVLLSIILVIFPLRSNNVITSVTSRKLTHIFTGICYVITWMFYPQTSSSKYWSALFPFSIGLILVLTYFIKHKARESIISIMSRNGQQNELIEGPFIYAIAITYITLMEWLQPQGITAIAILCAGDAMADVIGSRSTSVIPSLFGRKTIHGILSFIGFGLVTSLCLQLILLNNIWVYQTLIMVMVSSIVEYLSPSVIDNFTIVCSSLIVGHLCNWN